MQFRKKPVVIEAVQFTGEQPWPEGVEPAVLQHNLPRDRDYWPTGAPIIHTLEGPHLVRVGDWIITGVQGERYPCKPDIFAATYEPAQADNAGATPSATGVTESAPTSSTRPD
jgi:hypothetical protein